VVKVVSGKERAVMGDRILGLEEIAKRTGTPLNTLRYWRHLGLGPPTFKLGRRVVAMESDVEAWIREARESQPA
jgi:predicted DNA-binding transcriptional regulator AlpA